MVWVALKIRVLQRFKDSNPSLKFLLFFASLCQRRRFFGGALSPICANASCARLDEIPAVWQVAVQSEDADP